jgi:hypothetical protein
MGYNEFLKLKKNYDEEYLKQKEYEDDKRKYKEMYMSIPYRSISELNVNDDINKSLKITQEKVKQRVQPKYKLTSKEKNKNTKQFNEGTIIKKLENTLRKDIEEKEKKHNELQSSFKKIKDEKDKLEKELDKSLKKFKEDKDKLEKEKEEKETEKNKILKQMEDQQTTIKQNKIDIEMKKIKRKNT